MRQPLNLSQTDLDNLGEQAGQLDDWIAGQEETPTATHRFQMPSHLTLLGTLVLFNGLSLFYELGSSPGINSCWNGGCHV